MAKCKKCGYDEKCDEENRTNKMIEQLNTTLFVFWKVNHAQRGEGGAGFKSPVLQQVFDVLRNHLEKDKITCR